MRNRRVLCIIYLIINPYIHAYSFDSDGSAYYLSIGGSYDNDHSPSHTTSGGSGFDCQAMMRGNRARAQARARAHRNQGKPPEQKKETKNKDKGGNNHKNKPEKTQEHNQETRQESKRADTTYQPQKKKKESFKEKKRRKKQEKRERESKELLEQRTRSHNQEITRNQQAHVQRKQNALSTLTSSIANYYNERLNEYARLGLDLFERGREQEAYEINDEIFQGKPHQSIQLKESCSYVLGPKVFSFPSASRDIIEKKIITTIHDAASFIEHLTPYYEYHSRITRNIHAAIINGKNSLLKQAMKLNNEDKVQDAFWTLDLKDKIFSVYKSAAELAQGFKEGFYHNGQDVYKSAVEFSQKTCEGLSYFISHPTHVAETLFLLHKRISDYDQGLYSSYEEFLEQCPAAKAHNDAIDASAASLVSKVTSKITSIADLAHYCGERIIDFGSEYGAAFISPDQLELFDAPMQEYMLTYANQKRRELAHALYEKITNVDPHDLGYFAGNATGEILKVTCVNKTLDGLAETFTAFKAASSPQTLATLLEDTQALTRTQAMKGLEEINQVIKAEHYAHCTARIASLELEASRNAMNIIMKSEEAIKECGGLIRAMEVIEDTERELKHIPGYHKMIAKILQVQKDSNAKNIKGVFFELETALKIQKTEEAIEALDFIGLYKDIGTKEFDIVTKTRLIECKNWKEWTSKEVSDIMNGLGQKQKAAIELGKSLELHSKTPIPTTVKQWLNKRGISYFEYSEAS